MKKLVSITGAAATAAALLSSAAPANAFEIQKATGSGRELHFTAMPQYFYLSDAGSADIADDSEFDALRRAFESWDLVLESDARFSRFERTSRGVSDIYNDGGLAGRDRMNLVAFVESDWQEQPSQIAVTYTYYVDATGKILEDDIVMNAEDYTWTTGDAAVLTDVESIAAHEIGHAFGVGHSEFADATMFASAGVGETMKRSLSDDDMAAVQHLYPPGCCRRTKASDALAFVGCHVGVPGHSHDGGGAPWGAILLGVSVSVFVLVSRSRFRSRWTFGAFAVLGMMAVAGGAQASVAVALSLEDMTRDATMIVRGRVVWSEAQAGPNGSIVTLSQIEVDDVLKGDAPAVLTVVEPGGLPAGSEIGLKVSGAPQYQVGQEVVLFAEMPRAAYARNFPDAVRSLGMAQGAFRVVREPGQPVRLVRDLSDTSLRTLDGTAVADPLAGLTFEELVTRASRP